jgi:hypothetical protein
MVHPSVAKKEVMECTREQATVCMPMVLGGSFAEGRIGYREWACKNGRLADIHSINDRYDHDIDELIA